jgi:hypothetical protein
MVRVAGVLVVVALAAGCGGLSSEEVAREVANLQGTWVLVPDDGRPATTALRVKDDALAWETRAEGRPGKADYKFTAESGTGLVKLRLTGGPQNNVMLASCRVEGDELKLVLSWDNQSFPRRLNDSDGRLYVFRRQDVPWPAPDDPYWKEWARKRKQREAVLRDLGKGYIAALRKNAGPPKTPDELHPHLAGLPTFKEKGPAKTLERYEALYGVDLRTFRPENDGELLAWEAAPDEEGGRFVLTLGGPSGAMGPPTGEEPPAPGGVRDNVVSVRYLRDDQFRQNKKATQATQASSPKSP